MLSKVLSRVIILAMIVCLPQIARASFFDDSAGQWWMNVDQWEKFDLNDPQNLVSLTDQNNRLEFSFAGDSSSNYYLHTGGYFSKWSLSLSQDFDVNVSFHYDTNGITNDRSLGFDLLRWIAVSGTKIPNAGEEFTVESYTDKTKIYSYTFLQPDWQDVSRSSDDGVMEAHYDAALDTLQMLVKESNGNVVTIPALDGLRTQQGVDALQPTFYGTTGGDAFTGEHTYLQDFQITAGTPTAPEPVSAALFLFGGGAYGLARARKKSKRNL